jgi:hypothetical protein
MQYNRSRWLFLTLWAVVLTGCFRQPKVVSVPQVLLQELQRTADGAQARVLLHNFSNVEMTYSELDYSLRFGGVEVARAKVPLNLLVPKDSPENTTLMLRLSPAGRARLKGNEGFTFSISGTITSSKPSRVFEFNYEGRLSPTPGKPDFWR